MLYILNSQLLNDINDIVNTSTDCHLIVYFSKVWLLLKVNNKGKRVMSLKSFCVFINFQHI